MTSALYAFRYENLILVAGGIGISPFLAILSDIIHRIEEGKQCMPKNVLVLWSVKKSKELSLLSAVDAQTISSSVSDRLQLDIQAFVTQESLPPLVRTKNKSSVNSSSGIISFFHTHRRSSSSLFHTWNCRRTASSATTRKSLACSSRTARPCLGWSAPGTTSGRPCTSWRRRSASSWRTPWCRYTTSSRTTWWRGGTWASCSCCAWLPASPYPAGSWFSCGICTRSRGWSTTRGTPPPPPLPSHRVPRRQAQVVVTTLFPASASPPCGRPGTGAGRTSKVTDCSAFTHTDSTQP